MAEISIIMPTYNGSKYIREAIDSIISQSFTDWELIIINDSSTDNTPEIIQEYVEKDSRINTAKNDVNLGIAGTLNHGFRLASGLYWTWTSDDNVMYPDALEKMYAFLQDNHYYDMVYADMDLIDENGEIIGRVSEDVEKLYYNCVVGGCFLYTSKAAKETGEYDEGWVVISDYAYWLEINEKYNIAHISKTLYGYRQHGNTMSKLKFDRMNFEAYSLRLEKLNLILKKSNLDIKKMIYVDLHAQNPSKAEGLKSNFFGNDEPQELRWLNNINLDTKGKKLAIFGSGEFGRESLDVFGEENIAFFIDNNQKKIGKEIQGKRIISFEEYCDIQQDYYTVIAVGAGIISEIANQLIDNGITEFTTFIHKYKNIENFYKGNEKEKE